MKQIFALSLAILSVAVMVNSADARGRWDVGGSCPTDLNVKATWCGEDSQGLTKFKDTEHQRWGYFNSQNKQVVIEPVFRAADNFKFVKENEKMGSDFAYVVDKHGKGMYIDREGKMIETTRKQ